MNYTLGHFGLSIRTFWLLLGIFSFIVTLEHSSILSLAESLILSAYR